MTSGHLYANSKSCASFRSHRSIQNGVTVRKRQIRMKVGIFLSRVTLKFDWWPWEKIGHIFYAPSSFVHHFITIDQFKLELQFLNAKFGWKSAFSVPRDLEIWRMTLKNNRATVNSDCNSTIIVDTSIAVAAWTGTIWMIFRQPINNGNNIGK